jgi:hypothetical protein
MACLALLLFAQASFTLAAEEPEAANEEEEPRPAERLPEPLADVACNLTDLEKTGYFTVTSSEYGLTVDLGERAIIWTVRVDKVLTCRHAKMLLHRFRDLRFFDTEQGMRHEVHCDRLFYSARIETGAVDGALLDPGEEIQLWLVLDRVRIRILKSGGADTLWFGEPKR